MTTVPRWVIRIEGFPECFYEATSRSKARFMAWRDVNAAGWKVGFGEIDVMLAPFVNASKKLETAELAAKENP